MNWEAVGAIAGLIGVGLVIVSLLYVGIQVRQSNKTTRAEAELGTARTWTEFLARVAHSEDMADIWNTGHATPDDLTPPEKRRFIWIISEYFSIAELYYRQRDLDTLSQESWSQLEATVAGMLLNPLVGRWWTTGVTPFSPSFKAAIDRARTELGDTVWKYTPLAEI